jgi:hypothetical protein
MKIRNFLYILLLICILQIRRSIKWKLATCEILKTIYIIHHITRLNTPIHNILSTAPQLSISQKALGKLPEDGNVMPKYVGATIHNE